MSKKKLSKLLVLYLPYVVIGLVATNLGEAWRLAVGKELGDKIVSLMGTIPAAFANPLPSLLLYQNRIYGISRYEIFFHHFDYLQKQSAQS